MQRKTRQREVIRQVFESAGRPLHAQEVARAAKETLPTLGIATVYRTVKELSATGWLIPVEIAGGTRFERADRGHHHHFYCHGCDQAFDIGGCGEEFSRLAPRGFQVEGHELTLNGLCRSCARRGTRGEHA